jgi:hypothetical protein
MFDSDLGQHTDCLHVGFRSFIQSIQASAIIIPGSAADASFYIVFMLPAETPWF